MEEDDPHAECNERMATAFAAVIGLSLDQSRLIIGNLAMTTASAPGFFWSKLKLLKRLSKHPRGVFINLKLPDSSVTNTLRSEKIGSGTFGEVFESSVSDNAYKFIYVKKGADFEDEVRNVFLEVFIQNVLSTDPTHGKFICSVKHMYRGPDNGDHISIILKMEKLQGETIGSRRYDSWVDLKPTLIQTHETLTHFRNTYALRHRDLHSGNIMFKDGHIKLLDFGEACLEVCGRRFSKLSDPDCSSADLFILLGSLYEYGNLDPAVKVKLKSLLDVPIDQHVALKAALGGAVIYFKEGGNVLDIANAIADAKYIAKAKPITDAINAAVARGDHWEVANLKAKAKKLVKPAVFHQLYHYVLSDQKYWGNAGETLSTTDFGPLLAAMVGGRRKSRRRHRRRRRISRRP